jgi:hypothetical protein
MTQNEDDLAIETLLALRSEIAPNLDEQLIRSCYAVQKKHQFDHDRLQSVQAMDRLIEAYVDGIMSNDTGKSA